MGINMKIPLVWLKQNGLYFLTQNTLLGSPIQTLKWKGPFNSIPLGVALKRKIFELFQDAYFLLEYTGK